MTNWGKLSYVLLALALAFPLVLLAHSYLAGRELETMRAIFLRDRAAGIAARLEVMPPQQLAREDFESLLEGDPALLAIHVVRPPDGGAGPIVESIRAGRELYHTEEVRRSGKSFFRAFIPFHSDGQVNIAEIDLSLSAPDFILVHARHNQWIAAASGLVLLLVSAFAIWSVSRAARLERLAHLGTLSAVLAHEIRNPLGAIKGFAQLAGETADARGKSLLESVVRESRRLEDLVNSLLLYGRPLNPSLRRADWDELAADLAAHAREAIGARPIEFSIQSEIRQISTDPDLLKQALLNLVRNSVEAVPEGEAARIRLCAAVPNRSALVIAVEDDGPGIPEAVRSRLFAPFVTTKPSGAGLGLAISRKLAEVLGGSLRLVPLLPHGTRAEMRFNGTNTDR